MSFKESPLSNVIDCDESLVKSAFESAKKAFASWKALHYVQRGKIIYK